jgi:hypothetical protein
MVALMMKPFPSATMTLKTGSPCSGAADGGRGVQSEWHRGDVAAAGAARQSHGQPGVSQVAGQDAQRSPGKHFSENRQIVDDQS